MIDEAIERAVYRALPEAIKNLRERNVGCAARKRCELLHVKGQLLLLLERVDDEIARVDDAA